MRWLRELNSASRWNWFTRDSLIVHDLTGSRNLPTPTSGEPHEQIRSRSDPNRCGRPEPAGGKRRNANAQEAPPLVSVGPEVNAQHNNNRHVQGQPKSNG